MSRNESNGNGPASGSDHEESSGSSFTIVDTSSSGSITIVDASSSPESIVSATTEDETEMTDFHVEENEITDGMSDVHVSEAAGARRKDEYDVDFE
jgi:hypothetical protein